MKPELTTNGRKIRMARRNIKEHTLASAHADSIRRDLADLIDDPIQPPHSNRCDRRLQMLADRSPDRIRIIRRLHRA